MASYRRHDAAPGGPLPIPALLAVGAALALDEPSFYAREAVAVAGWPTGLLSNTVAEVRTPLHRSESILFRSTMAGVGGQVLVSPAFASVGPRLSFAPIDVFDVNLKAARAWYYGNAFGALPYDAVGDRLGRQRSARGDEGFPTAAWVFTVEPTLKLKLGPIIAFDAWTLDHLRIARPDGVDSPYLYEPYRDLVVAWQDWSVEQQAAVVWEALPGGDRPLLRVGATVKDTRTLVSRDHRTNLGPLLMVRPGTAPAVPTLVGMALWYLRDADRVGPVPFLAAQARWEVERPLGGD